MYFSNLRVSHKSCFIHLRKSVEKLLLTSRHSNKLSSNVRMKNFEKASHSCNYSSDSSTIAKENLGKHIKITSESYRNTRISEAFVQEIFFLSTTVKGFTLKILDPEFTFLAGQWVDVFIPKLETVGGFSICSPPIELQEKGTITLGIKCSFWPPAKWFFDKCQPCSKISVRVGGDFYFPTHDDKPSDLLLIAGGVGVNPIFSIYSHLFYMREQKLDAGRNTKISLLYSAKNEEELLFKSKIDDIARSHPENVYVQYFTTNEPGSPGSGITESRISQAHIANALKWLKAARTKVYICGPPSMIETLNEYILECGVAQHRIHFEKWW